MKFLNILMILVAFAVAAPLPGVRNGNVATTSPGYAPWSIKVPFFFDTFPILIPVQEKVNFFKRQSDDGDDGSVGKYPELMVFIIISFVLEFIIFSVAISYLVYFCVSKYLERRRERNPERLRARRLLESRRQSAAIELDVLQPHSAPQLPSAENMDMPPTPPRTLGFYDSDSDRSGTNTPVRQGMRDSQTQTDLPEVITMNAGAERQCVRSVSSSTVPEIHVTITEATPVSTPNSHSSSPGVGTSHIETDGHFTGSGADNQASSPIPHIPGSTATSDNADENSDQDGLLFAAVYQPEINANQSDSSSDNSYSTAFGIQVANVHEAHAYGEDATEIHSQNGIIVRDWAYHAF
ncbi:hypothetical protein F5Y10DRAFT_262135 [Nemania abortiva]|nr:hypothetical protein F5Y10DRAFT_262135 [Nemania abortiva]